MLYVVWHSRAASLLIADNQQIIIADENFDLKALKAGARGMRA